MLLRRVEIGVAGNPYRQMQGGVDLPHQRAFAQGGVVAQRSGLAGEQAAQLDPHAAPRVAAKGNEIIERVARENVLACRSARHIQQTGRLKRCKVDDPVADRHTRTRRSLTSVAENPERQILDREVARGVVRCFDPALARRIERRLKIARRVHRCSGLKCFLRPCQHS
jgi:hypothetical protein